MPDRIQSALVIARADVDTALEEVRPLVQADGADLVLKGVDDTAGQVVLALDLANVSCLECVLPPELLHTMISDAFSRRVPGLSGVVVEDPREDA
jgi:Fe-S cluster biogenesis protein NfuA